MAVGEEQVVQDIRERTSETCKAGGLEELARTGQGMSRDQGDKEEARSKIRRLAKILSSKEFPQVDWAFTNEGTLVIQFQDKVLLKQVPNDNSILGRDLSAPKLPDIPAGAAYNFDTFDRHQLDPSMESVQDFAPDGEAGKMGDPGKLTLEPITIDRDLKAVVELHEQQKHMQELAAKIAGQKERLQFEAAIEAFERRAGEMVPPMNLEELSKIYKEVNRRMEDGDKFANPQRVHLENLIDADPKLSDHQKMTMKKDIEFYENLATSHDHSPSRLELAEFYGRIEQIIETRHGKVDPYLMAFLLLGLDPRCREAFGDVSEPGKVTIKPIATHGDL